MEYLLLYLYLVYTNIKILNLREENVDYIWDLAEASGLLHY